MNKRMIINDLKSSRMVSAAHYEDRYGRTDRCRVSARFTDEFHDGFIKEISG